MRPRLLDLFCGAGGCSVGYYRAGFEVFGVDLHPQPNYPFGSWFLQEDALSVLRRIVDGHWYGNQFDAIHASPPCQAHSSIAKQIRKLGKTRNEHPDLVPQTRELLEATGLPYVIENVVGAPLLNPIMLCGSSFGLDVRRHRLFELGGGFSMMALPCAHHWQTPRFRSLDKRRHMMSVVPVYGAGQIKGLSSVVGVHGHTNYAGERELREKAMGIDWMSPYELTQAIPPAYTEFIGRQLLAHLEAEPVYDPFGAAPADPNTSPPELCQKCSGKGWVWTFDPLLDGHGGRNGGGWADYPCSCNPHRERWRA